MTDRGVIPHFPRTYTRVYASNGGFGVYPSSVITHARSRKDPEMTTAGPDCPCTGCSPPADGIDRCATVTCSNPWLGHGPYGYLCAGHQPRHRPQDEPRG